MLITMPIGSGESGGVHVVADSQNSSNEGQTTITFDSPPSGLVVYAINGTTVDSYVYVKDEMEHYLSTSAGLVDSYIALLESGGFLFNSAHTQFRFHGYGGTSNTSYNIYWWD